MLPSGRTLCGACEERDEPTIPWERRAEIGLLRAASQTIAGVLLRPSHLFAMRSRERSVLPALLLGLVVDLLGQAGATAIEIATIDRTRAELRADPIGRYFADLVTPDLFLAQLAATPFLFPLTVLAQAALWWIALRAVGGLRREMRAIVRALAYAGVTGLLAPAIAALRLLGPVGDGVALALVGWSLGITVLGVSRSQDIEPLRGMLAFVVWSALAGCLACGGLLAAAWVLASHLRIPLPT